MPLVNYEGDSSEDEDNATEQTTVTLKKATTRTLHLPVPTSNAIIDDDDDDDDKNQMDQHENATNSSSLLANLPKPHEVSSSHIEVNTTEIAEGELEDIVRGENKEYAKNIPQLPKAVKRKRDGPVKIFIPTIEDDSDDEDKPKRKPQPSKTNCALLKALPPPVNDEDAATPSLPVVKNPTATTPQISSSGLFIPYALNKKQQQTKKTSATTPKPLIEGYKNDSENEDDDDNSTDFLGLSKSDQIQITNTDVESILRETLPKSRPVVVEEPPPPNPSEYFQDLDEPEQVDYQPVNDDNDELLKFLPKSERYKEIKHVHIDSMMGDAARLQLLKNTTEERETMLAQAAIHVPKGETKKRSQITYLIAKAQHDDLQLKNMWSEQKLTKRQTQAKYGF